MAVVVSKADALVEMVKAYDSQQIKKANMIGKVLCRSIQKDNQENRYCAFIDLDRETKQFFPVKVRKRSQEIKKISSELGTEILIDGDRYEFKIEEDTIILCRKQNDF